MENVKLCFLIPSVNAGGIETYLLRFLGSLNNLENVTIVVRSDTRGELYNDYQYLRCRLHFMPLGYINPLRMWRLYRFFKRKSFDTVCDFNANFAGLPMFIALIAGVPKRVAFYRQGRNHFKPSLHRNVVNQIMNRLVYYHATNVLSNSGAALNYFFSGRKPADDRFQIIPNGFNPDIYDIPGDKATLRQELGIANDKFVVGHCGRLDRAKNHHGILKTAALLVHEDPSFHFLLCGSNTQRLNQEVEEMGLSKHFSLLGFRKDVPELLNTMDLFYFPSYTEGQPNALIEAMLADLPLVASCIAPIRECMPLTHHHWLVEPDDSKSACRKIMEQRQLMAAGIKKQNLRNWAREKFNAEANFRAFEDVIFNKKQSLSRRNKK